MRISAVAGAFIALFAFALFQWWKLDRAQSTIATQASALSQKKTELADKNSQLIAVSLVSSANDRAQRDLMQRNEDLQSLLATRQSQLKAIMNENTELKRWADTVLPADIVRLHTRPALTGAAAYRAWLSENNGVLVSGIQPENKR